MRSTGSGCTGTGDRAGKGRVASFLAKLLAGLAVSAFFIWLTLRDRDLSAIATGLRQADHLWIVACIGVLLLAHLLRTLRWGLLIAPLGSFSFSHLNRASAVGFMALLLLPMRLGDLGRPWLISRPDPRRGGRAPVRMSQAMGTLVFERIFDGLLLTGLLVALLLAGDYESRGAEWLLRGAAALFLAFAAAAALVYSAFRRRHAALRVTSFLTGWLGERLRSWALAGLDRLISGLGGPARGRGRAGFALGSVAFWMVNAAAIIVLARAFGIQMSLPQALLVLGTQVIGVMIPAGPGMLGTFQYFTILALSFFLPPDTLDAQGVALANVLWACLFVQQVGLGLILLPRRLGVLGRLAAGEVGAKDGAERAPSAEADGDRMEAPRARAS